MANFNTGNPVPSADVRDLHDNAVNLDEGINGPAGSWRDRKGAMRRSWAGLEAEYDQFIADNGLKRYASWAALQADTSRPDGFAADVIGDAGTHVDPVSGATVSNSGQYRATGGQWQWMREETLEAKADKVDLAATDDIAKSANRRTQSYRAIESDDPPEWVSKLGRLLFGLTANNWFFTPKGFVAPAVNVDGEFVQGNTGSSAYHWSLEDRDGRVIAGWRKHDNQFEVRGATINGGPASAGNAGLLRGDFFAIGDSITAYGTAYSGSNNSGTSYAPTVRDQSWHAWSVLFTGGRLRFVGQSATGGYTVTQVKNSHLPIAIAAKPTMCVVMCGRNDIVQGIDIAAVTIPAFEIIFSQLRQAGIIPVVCSMSAQGNSGNSAQRQAEHRLNMWLRQYAYQHNLPFVDLHRPTVDPATGDWVVGLNQDVSHPRGAGAKVMGRALADAMLQWVSTSEPPHADEQIADGLSRNRLPNGLFLDATGGDADGWVVETAGDAAIETDAAVRGNVWHLGTAASTKRSRTISVTAGDKLGFGFYLKHSAQAAKSEVYVLAGGRDSNTHLAGIRQWLTVIDSFSYFWQEFAVPAGVSSITVVVNSEASGLSLAQMGIFNLDK